MISALWNYRLSAIHILCNGQEDNFAALMKKKNEIIKFLNYQIAQLLNFFISIIGTLSENSYFKYSFNFPSANN